MEMYVLTVLGTFFGRFTVIFQSLTIFLQVIYVYRHPKDTIVSHYNFQRFLMEDEIGRPVSHTPEQFADFFDVLITGKRKYLINVC